VLKVKKKEANLSGGADRFDPFLAKRETLSHSHFRLCLLKTILEISHGHINDCKEGLPFYKKRVESVYPTRQIGLFFLNFQRSLSTFISMYVCQADYQGNKSVRVSYQCNKSIRHPKREMQAGKKAFSKHARFPPFRGALPLHLISHCDHTGV
jgi:hypothetical protein